MSSVGLRPELSTQVLPNGDLRLEPYDPTDVEWDRLLACSPEDALCSLLEYQQGNGWAVMHGEDYAMTDSPLITDDTDFPDDADRERIRGTTWWFPNYAVENPIKTMRDQGFVVFTKGCDPPVYYQWFWGEDPDPDDPP